MLIKRKNNCCLTSLGLVRAVFRIVPFTRWGGIPCSGVTIPFCFSAWPFTCPFFGFFLCFLYLTLQNQTDTKMATLIGRIQPIFLRPIFMSPSYVPDLQNDLFPHVKMPSTSRPLSFPSVSNTRWLHKFQKLEYEHPPFPTLFLLDPST